MRTVPTRPRIAPSKAADDTPSTPASSPPWLANGYTKTRTETASHWTRRRLGQDRGDRGTVQARTGAVWLRVRWQGDAVGPSSLPAAREPCLFAAREAPS